MKPIVIIFMILYLYALSFGIFLTTIFRIPAPVIFCFPLVFVFNNKEETPFLYSKEIISLTIAIFLYYVVGLSEFTTFARNILSIMICAFFFNYFIGKSRNRLNSSILIFYLLLAFSSVILLFDVFYDISDLRGLFMDEKVIQSPSGIAIYQFNFGYQIAALTPFLFIYTCTFNKSIIIKIAALVICLILLLLGLQRSAFVTFIISSSIFLILYYRFKSIFLISITLLLCGLVYYLTLNNSLHGMSNIIVKNEQNNPAHNRSSFTAENFNIYLNHPYGLIFYGKNWGDVIYRNYVFSEGMTSHNAYLMFFTYLGPFLGLGLLITIYHKICSIFLRIIKEIRLKENALMVCLCFSFLGISMNSLFHNAWLIEANGPTVFLFFCILHLQKLKEVDTEIQSSKILEYAQN